MSPSQWLDIAVLAVAFIAAVSGWRSGALGSVLSFVGVLLALGCRGIDGGSLVTRPPLVIQMTCCKFIGLMMKFFLVVRLMGGRMCRLLWITPQN